MASEKMNNSTKEEQPLLENPMGGTGMK